MDRPLDLRLVGGLTLNELLAELEDDSLSNATELSITMMPPTNACNDVTDEDSGDEDIVSINNLPGSQLRSEAEVNYLSDEADLQNVSPVEQNSSLFGTDVDDENIPLAVLKLAYDKTKKQYQWSKNDIENKTIPSLKLEGPKNNRSPVEIFHDLFDSNIVSLFVEYTNLYAAKKNKPINVTDEEIMRFFGILLLSGYVPLPRRRMYWEQLHDTNNEFVSNAMPRDRFESIMSNIHCCDNDNLDPSDKFAKIRPFLIAINKKFLEYTIPQENHSIDECMVPYFGKHGCKQCILNKPVRFGYKVWIGCTSTGYVNWVEPYQGAKSVIKNAYKDFGLGPSVILEYADILRSCSDYSYHLFFDNFFTTIPLLEVLSSYGIRGTGTIRENRCSNCPIKKKQEMKKKERGYSEFQSIKSKNIVIAKWYDNNVVNIASNAVSVNPMQNVSRYSRKEHKKIIVKQPYNIHIYNKNMGGVDRCDQNISLYRSKIRGKKWYFCLIAFCLDLVEQNAWQLHKFQGGKLDHLTFRRRIATALLQKTDSRKRGRPSSLENIDSRFDRLDHLVGQQENQTRCRVCHKKVKTICLKCKVALHISCFAPYHIK